MAMALTAERTASVLVTGMSKAATAPLSAQATSCLEVGMRVYTKVLKGIGLASVIGPSTPGHILMLELVVRVYGVVLFRPMRAAHGHVRSSSSASARVPVEARDAKGRNIVIIFFYINAAVEEWTHIITIILDSTSGEGISVKTVHAVMTIMTMNGSDFVTGATAAGIIIRIGMKSGEAKHVETILGDIAMKTVYGQPSLEGSELVASGVPSVS